MKKAEHSSLSKKFLEVEKKLTKGLIRWKLKRDGLQPSDKETLNKTSENIVNEAHRIIKRRGKSAFEQLKQAKQEFLKAYRDKDNK